LHISLWRVLRFRWPPILDLAMSQHSAVRSSWVVQTNQEGKQTFLLWLSVFYVMYSN
jgi:hypothetical protein